MTVHFQSRSVEPGRQERLQVQHLRPARGRSWPRTVRKVVLTPGIVSPSSAGSGPARGEARPGGDDQAQQAAGVDRELARLRCCAGPIGRVGGLDHQGASTPVPPGKWARPIMRRQRDDVGPGSALPASSSAEAESSRTCPGRSLEGDLPLGEFGRAGRGPRGRSRPRDGPSRCPSVVPRTVRPPEAARDVGDHRGRREVVHRLQGRGESLSPWRRRPGPGRGRAGFSDGLNRARDRLRAGREVEARGASPPG